MCKVIYKDTYLKYQDAGLWGTMACITSVGLEGNAGECVLINMLRVSNTSNYDNVLCIWAWEVTQGCMT